MFLFRGRFLLSLFVMSLFIGEVAVAADGSDKASANSTSKSGEYKTIEWTDLIPSAEMEILLNPPSYINEIEDGSAEDQLSQQIEMAMAQSKNDAYQQALVSTNIKPEMNGKKVRIPGFIVPLEYKDDQLVTEFFLVPYFGACIHMPPPPPNQIIYIKYPKGLDMPAFYDPVWISGMLKTSLLENDMATAAYAIDMKSYEEYIDY